MADAPDLLRQGDEGPAVEALQRALSDAGFDPGPADGIFGTATRRAVGAFQTAAGLPDDGVYGAQTREALELYRPLRLTSSVDEVRALEGGLTAARVAWFVWDRHRDYPQRAVALRLLDGANEDGVDRRTGREWVDGVIDLLDTEALARLEPEQRQLHGRLLVDGLTRLDPVLEQLLDGGGVLPALRASITPNPDTLFRSRRASAPPPNGDGDGDDGDDGDGKRPPGRRRRDAKLIADTPAKEDLLDREGFATGLATLIHLQRGHQAGPEEPVDPARAGPILIHLYGAWGSGKTSLFGMLRRSLETPPKGIDRTGRPWLCVTFNAWGHQRSAPPWWWLMDRVYREARTGRREDRLPTLAWHRRLLLWAWWWQYVLLALALAPFLVLAVVFGVVTVDRISGASDAITVVVGFFVALGAAFALLRSTKSSLLVGSPRAAATLLQSGGDPYRRIRKRYARLVEVVGHNVLVFIDDLDRCQPAYVVELLEGVQTIFNEAPVTYLVAADREWVSESFDRVYADLGPVMRRPGRPLGYLFLEKTFAVSAPLPRASAAAQERYWEVVLSGGTLQVDPIADADRESARAELEHVPSEDALARAAGLSSGDLSGPARALREQAAIQVAQDVGSDAQHHFLAPYLPLLDQNPRALKRLGNAYGIATMGRIASLDISVGDDEVDSLVRWTILTLRWPQLAGRVVEQPRFLAHVRTGDGDALGPELADLAGDAELLRLMTDPVGGVEPHLEAWVVKEFDPRPQPVSP